MTNTSIAWTIQNKRIQLKDYGGLRAVLKRVKKLQFKHGARLYKVVREWKKRRDGTTNDHVHFFVVFSGTVGKTEFVKMLFGSTTKWLLRQATAVAKGTYDTFDAYLEPTEGTPKFKVSPGKVLLRYPSDKVVYKNILQPRRCVQQTQGSLFKSIGEQIKEGASITALIQATPYLAIHIDKLIKIKGQFFRSVTQNLRELEPERDWDILSEYSSNNTYVVNYEKSLDGMHPEFQSYVDQELLVIKHKTYEDDLVRRFISYMKWAHYVQLSKWNVKWLFIRYVVLEKESTQTNLDKEMQQNGGFTINNDNNNDNYNTDIEQFGSSL